MLTIKEEPFFFFDIFVFQKPLNNAIRFQQRLRSPLQQQEHKLKKAHQQNQKSFFVLLFVAPPRCFRRRKKRLNYGLGVFTSQHDVSVTEIVRKKERSEV